MIAVIISLISTVCVISMSYHVYVTNHRHTIIDSYLKQIISLYYKIEDDGNKVKENKHNPSSENFLNQCYRDIEINACMMRFYVKKFPVQYEGKDTFIGVINSLSHSPDVLSDYDKLSDEFKKFFKQIDNMNEYETRIDKMMHYIIR